MTWKPVLIALLFSFAQLSACTQYKLEKFDINNGVGGPAPMLHVVNNPHCFLANDSVRGYELWKYDAVSGFSLVADNGRALYTGKLAKL